MTSLSRRFLISIAAISLLLTVVGTAGTFLVFQRELSSRQIAYLQDYVRERSSNVDRRFSNLTALHQAAGEELARRMSRLSDADTVRLADEYFPRQPDGTRRSRDKYFDGHLDGSEYVYGMGAFLSDADQIPIDQLRALVASFELVGDFGQAARKDYDNFYFFVPPTTRLVMYGPTVRIPLEAIEGGGEIMLDDVREEMDISHARILLAEDHPTNQKVVQLVLGAVGIEPVIVENGRLALDALRAERFDVVLMDMQMPELDGLSATSQLRAREHAEGLPRTPVIMLTANALDEHVRAGREAGADAHLSKPIRADALIEAIIAAMADAEARAEAAAA